MTPAQLASLKAAILADPVLAAHPMTADGAFNIAAAMNALASPAFWAYRIGIPSGEIGKAVNYVAVAAMTTANLQRVSDFLRMNLDAFNGRDDIKTFLSDTFSGALGGQGQATRDSLDLMLRRQVTRFERLYATGTGSTAAPGALVLEGPVSYQDVETARALP